MSLKFIDPIDQIISSSQINESHESLNAIQNPESFINALQEKLTKNPDLIQEIDQIFSFIFSKPEISCSHPTSVNVPFGQHLQRMSQDVPSAASTLL